MCGNNDDNEIIIVSTRTSSLLHTELTLTKRMLVVMGVAVLYACYDVVLSHAVPSLVTVITTATLVFYHDC